MGNDENKVKNQAELPYYSKYLLLAAYFASYNPATTDRRFFTKKSCGRMSKRAKQSAKAAKNLDKKFLGKKYSINFFFKKRVLLKDPFANW